MDEFIELNRRFGPHDEQQTVEHDDVAGFGEGFYFKTHSWFDVLKNLGTVILAGAGFGKSYEFRNQTYKLRADGNPAFYCPLENLASLPLHDALEIGTSDELNAWIAGDRDAWFFLDAADEAKLQSPRQFERAIGRYANIVGPCRFRTRTIISTRPSAWNAVSDRETLFRCLGLKIYNKPAQETKKAVVVSADPSSDKGDQAASNAESPPPPELNLSELCLLPLNREQVKIFAKAKGVTDADDFISAVESFDAESFANRPCDLPGLIDLWRRTDRLGSYSEIVLNNIQLKLKELNSIHSANALLTPEKTFVGAERVAAAVVFTRKTSLLVSNFPDFGSPIHNQAFDPRDVLLDWRQAEVMELLGRAIFDESLCGTVRFHHRRAREYLAARWLCRLLRQRKHRRGINALLFRRPYGTEGYIVVPSQKPIAAWLALWDQDIRDRLLKIDPKVLLESGDASALPVETRAALLREVASRYADRNHTPLSLLPSQLRRLAHPGLADTIRELLKHYATHEDVQHLLLRLIREGQLPGFGAEALDIVTSQTGDKYSRGYAADVIGAIGSEEEKLSLKHFLLQHPERHESDLIACGIRALAPKTLDIQEIKTLLEAAPAPRPYGYDLLESVIDHVIAKLDSPALQSDFLNMLSSLVCREPHVSEYCPVSSRFAWLLQPAMTLAEKLIQQHPQGPFTEAELDTITASTAAQYVHMYTGDTQKTAVELLTQNGSLRNALFWRLVNLRRSSMKDEISDFWQLRFRPELHWFNLKDAEFFLESLRTKTNEPDRLLSLSMLVYIHHFNSEPTDLLAEIRSASASSETLKAKLEEHLRPKELSPAHLEAERENERFKRENQERQRQSAADRAKWIERLKANPDQVGNLEKAKDGIVLNNTVWLLDELQKKSGSNSYWSISDCSALIPEFGEEIATAFRDYCLSIWHLYEPKLRSEGDLRGNNTPWIVVLGLCGIAMEAESDPKWTEKLIAEDVLLATRYALWELNGFPTWLESLWRTNPEGVESIFLQEIAWELSGQQSENPSGYVLSRLRWSTKALREEFRSALMELVQQTTDCQLDALSESLAIVLRDASPIPEEFTAATVSKVDSSTDNAVKGFWLATLLCVNAEVAIGRFEAWVQEASSPAEAEGRVSLVLNHIWGDRFHSLSPEHKSFENPGILLRLLKLTHTHVRVQDDIEHEAVFSPGVRDNAQQARAILLNILCKIPGRETYQALLELSRFHAEGFARDRMLVLAEERAEADCEGDPWEPHDVPKFAADAEHEPRSQYDLHRIALNRLDDLKLDLEEGDESEASLLQKVENEVELRKVLANRLKHASAGKYTTGSEEELADKTRSDIRLHNPAVEARIPIELKVADQWSASVLRERLENQLVGQYLREASYGIFLLVHRGNNAKDGKSSWKISIGGRSHRVDFPALVAWLSEEAKQLCQANPTIDGLDVIGIDLTVRKERAAAINAASCELP